LKKIALRTRTAQIAGAAIAGTIIVAACGGGSDPVPVLAPASAPAPAPAPAPTVPEGGPVAPDKPLAKAYNDAAKALAVGTDNPILAWTYRVWCETGYRTAPKTGVNGIDALVDPSVDLVTPRGFTAQSESSTPYPAGGVRFLDNAWVFGTDGTAMVVVRTPSGNFILFDALNSVADMQSQVIDQMRFAGLDTSRITHVFVGHEHGDHYAGVNLAARLSPNLKVIAGAPAAEAIAKARSAAETRTYAGTSDEQAAARANALDRIPQKVDITIPAASDMEQGAMRLQLESDLEVVVMMTPGHTNGAIQVIVPVVHQGKTEKLLVWSGNDASNDNTDKYASGANLVEAFVVKEQPTAWINTHTYQGAVFGHLRRLAASPNTAPNPMLMGVDGVRRWAGIFAACNRALAERYRDGTWNEM
jgi:metallo-beta-lactamase class B